MHINFIRDLGSKRYINSKKLRIDLNGPSQPVPYGSLLKGPKNR